MAQTDLDARLTAIIAPVVATMGLDLVRVLLSGQPGSLTLQVMAEDPATGQTSLRLGFSLTKLPGRSQMPPVGSETESVSSDGTKLSLRGLLHYLWDQAELTKWHPGFAGKRTWGTVRRQLLSASEDKFARGDSLRSRLYIPETFSVDHRDAINARRLAKWSTAQT